MRCAQIIHKLHSILIKRKMYDQESGKKGMKRKRLRSEEKRRRTLRKSAHYARLVINLGHAKAAQNRKEKLMDNKKKLYKNAFEPDFIC